MRTLSKRMLTALFSAVVCVFVFAGNTSFATDQAAAEGWLEQKISLECGGRTLQEVLQEVSSNLGIEIFYDAKLAENVVNCSYTDSTVENILNRLFRDYNKGVVINAETKTVVVKIFGVTEYIIASEKRSGEILSLPFLGDMTPEELSELHALQFQEYQDQINDAEEVVPGVDVTRGDLKILHEEQYSQYTSELNDGSQIVPEVNSTRDDLKALHEEQYSEYSKQLNDPEGIVPGVEISRGNLKTLHEEQYSNYQKQLNDPDEIVPGVGITRGELKRLHESQSN